MLPETPLAEASQIANRLCLQIARTTIESDNKAFSFTVSCGVTQLRNDDTSPDSIIKRADVALYRAKQSGRNQVVIADDTEPSVSN